MGSFRLVWNLSFSKYYSANDSRQAGVTTFYEIIMFDIVQEASMIRRYMVLLLFLGFLVPQVVPAADPTDSAVRMMETIRFLASPEMKGRGIGTPELDRAAAYIAKEFEAVGLVPGGDNGSWYQEWTDEASGVPMRNVIGLLPGRNPMFTGQSVVLGAHYDHLGTGGPGSHRENAGRVHPGADDNASGVAVLLDAVRALTLKQEPERTIVFAAFTGEEAGRLGSRRYVRNERQYPVQNCIAMVNLDTVGRLGKKNLIAIGGNSAKEWPGLFAEIAKTLKVDIAVPLQELDASDQKSFHDVGVPAVQLFSGPHEDYHRPSDSADKIDERGLVKVAAVTRALVLYLANNAASLTSPPSSAAASESAPRTDRKVTLGIIPDFTYNEKGVRLGGAAPGGPAAAAGMREGDIIVRIDDKPVVALKDLSDLLKTRRPGDRVTVHFLRQEKEMKISVILKEK